MALAELLRGRRLVAAAVAGALVGAAIGLFLPIRAADRPKSDEASWSLPAAQDTKRFRNDQFQAVRSAGFWGEIKRPGAGGSKPAAWTLGAIVTRPQLRIAVSVPGKPEMSWIGIGSAMPDGSTFVAATRDTVWYEQDGCRRARKLYVKPTAEAEACIGASGKASGAAVPPASRTSPAASPPAAPPARSTP